MSEDAARSQLHAVRAALQQGQSGQAVNLLKELVNAGTATAEAYELLGMALAMTGNSAAARKAFIESTHKDPSRISAHYNYAVFLAATGDLDEAAEENRTVLFLSPQHPGALALQKKLLQRLRERDFTSEEGFAVVGSGIDPSKNPSGILGKMKCPICGGANIVTARVCQRCGSLIPEMEELVQVE
jgi:tetratricopeptide (TPR) repeat protein